VPHQFYEQLQRLRQEKMVTQSTDYQENSKFEEDEKRDATPTKSKSANSQRPKRNKLEIETEEIENNKNYKV
jgi:hypothetical protein